MPDQGAYEAFMDTLQGFLITNVDTSEIGNGGAITWTLGDVGQTDPSTLPAGFLIPYFDTVTPYSNGLDMDTYATPIMVIEDLHKYGAPVANQNVEGGMEMPGYRVLMQYADAIRQAFRSGGTGITLEGNIATSLIAAVTYPWVTIGDKPYRGVRLAVQAQQRVARLNL
jgi:hypothetical protein